VEGSPVVKVASVRGLLAPKKSRIQKRGETTERNPKKADFGPTKKETERQKKGNKKTVPIFGS